MTQSHVPFLDSASATRKFHTNQRSNGTDTVEQYVQQVAEPYLASYRISSGTAASTATANSHLLQIMAGASLRVCVRRIWVYQAAAATSTSNDQMAIYRLTTAGTGGTALTPASLDPADAASGAAAMLLPTAKGTEGTLIEYRHAILHATDTSIGLNPIAIFDFTSERTKGLWIAAGTSNGIALKMITSDAAATVRIVADIVESAEGA